MSFMVNATASTSQARRALCLRSVREVSGTCQPTRTSCKRSGRHGHVVAMPSATARPVIDAMDASDPWHDCKRTWLPNHERRPEPSDPFAAAPVWRRIELYLP
jgi:hypothetical protein